VIALLLTVFVVGAGWLISIVRHAGPQPPWWPAAGVLAAVVITQGAVLSARRRPLGLLLVAPAVLSLLLATTMVMLLDSTPGSADCPGQDYCDTAFAVGAMYVFAVSYLPSLLLVAAGWVMGRALRRPHRAS
jgi:hypothetical protein